MRSFKSAFVFLSLVILVSLVSAYAPARNTGIAIRAEAASSSGDSSQTDKPSQTGENNSEATGSDSQSNSQSNSDENTSNKDKPSPTDKNGSSKTSDKGTKTTKKPKTTVDPRLPPGGIVMVTPGPFDPSTYVKIGANATFAWNYTSLEITPSAVDVVAYCSKNDHYYTIASNQSVQETGSAVWDTKPYKTASVRLLVEHYTLIVHDSKRGPTDVAPAGELGVSRPFIFGVYEPHDNPNLKKKRTMGSAAISTTDRQAVWFMMGMVGITIASFTWFASGLGLFA